MKLFTPFTLAVLLFSSAPLFAQGDDAGIRVKATASKNGSSLTVSGWREDIQVWEKVWMGLPQTELNSFSPHTVDDNTLYVVVAAKLHAIDLATGQLIFEPVEVGSCQHKPVVDSEDGTIYCCGYYGPVITAVSSVGNRMWSYENEDFWWPEDLKLKGHNILVTHYSSDGETEQVSIFDRKGKLLKTQAAQSGELRKYEVYVDGRGVADVDILWEDIDGFGSISGTFSYIKHEIEFVGENPEDGFIWIKFDDEKPDEYRKVNGPNGIVWVAKSENSSRLELRPVKESQEEMNNSANGSNSSEGTVRHYLLSGNGLKKTARLVWDDIDGLGAVNGIISDEIYKGSNHTKGKLTLVSEDGGTTYQLTRTSTGSPIHWEGKVYFAQDDTGVNVEMIQD